MKTRSEAGRAAHASALAWRIHGQGSLAGTVHGLAESHTTDETQHACMHTVEPYSAVKRGEMLPFAAT